MLSVKNPAGTAYSVLDEEALQLKVLLDVRVLQLINKGLIGLPDVSSRSIFALVRDEQHSDKQEP